MSVPKGCLRTDRRAGSLRKMGAVCIFFRKFAPETKTIHDMAITEIRPGIHYVGVNDRTTTRFEGLWPLPIGVSYNSYLVVGEQVALIDTVEESFGSRLFENIREVIGDRKIDYLVVNHMEPDHSSSIAALRLRYPDLKIVGNAKTLQMIGGYYGIDAGTLEVKEGDTLDLGGGKVLSFHLIPMVHWPETMVTWYAAEGVIFSGDAFGTFGALDGGITDSEVEVDRYWDEMRRYYACIVGKYGTPVQKALQKVGGLEIRTICPTHGPVWQERIGEVVALYDRTQRLIRDAFLFGCFTGLSYVDIRQLTPQNIQYQDRQIWICTSRCKTASEVSVRLFPVAEAILSRHLPVPEDGRIFDLPTNGWCNACLQVVLQQAGISRHITFHCARHTFATTITLSQGVAIETICKLLGHKNIRTTQIYATLTHAKLANDMELLSERLEKQFAP